MPQPKPLTTFEISWRGTTRQQTVSRDVAKIGRDSAADLNLEDPHASHSHAVLELADGQWNLIDLGNTPPTLVNGAKISKATLREGDVITIADTTIKWVSSAAHLEFELNELNTPSAAIPADPEARHRVGDGIAQRQAALNPIVYAPNKASQMQTMQIVVGALLASAVIIPTIVYFKLSQHPKASHLLPVVVPAAFLVEVIGAIMVGRQLYQQAQKYAKIYVDLATKALVIEIIQPFVPIQRRTLALSTIKGLCDIPTKTGQLVGLVVERNERPLAVITKEGTNEEHSRLMSDLGALLARHQRSNAAV